LTLLQPPQLALLAHYQTCHQKQTRSSTKSTLGRGREIAIIKGFNELGWDPAETDGKKIKSTIQSDPETFALLQHYFSTSDGGTKSNNNQLYSHYKDIGCEWITGQTRAGNRRLPQESASFSSLGSTGTAFVANYTHSLVLLLLSTAAYLANEETAGGRKRAAEEDEAGSPESARSGITLGSNDTNEDDDYYGTMSKPTPNKKPAAAGAAKNVPPSASKPKGTGDQEVDEIMSAMSGMQLSNQTDWGFDFKGQAPYFWWNYNYLSETYCKMEILMNQVAHEDVRASVSQSGKYLLIHVNLPKFFLNVGRLFGYYFDATAGEATFTQEAAMFAQGQSAVNKIKQMMELTGGAKTVIAIKLPFKVQANFLDPYHPEPDFAGYALRSYLHERSPAPAAPAAGGAASHDPNTVLKVTVLSVSMIKADSVLVTKPITGAHVDVDNDLMNLYN